MYKIVAKKLVYINLYNFVTNCQQERSSFMSKFLVYVLVVAG
jgi:hypothetical protein